MQNKKNTKTGGQNIWKKDKKYIKNYCKTRYIWHSYRSYKIISRVFKKAPALPFPQLCPDQENRGSLVVYLKGQRVQTYCNKGEKLGIYCHFSSPQLNT